MYLAKKAKKVVLIRQLGWDETEEVFYHPALLPEAEFELLPFFKLEDFLPSDEVRREHHELILKFLKEGRLLGAKLVLALAGLWTNFVVIDKAPEEAEKTLTSWLACQLYNKWRKPLVLWATRKAWEVIFSILKNMPIPLDQGFALSERNLRLKITDVKGVAFLTSERDLGLFRLDTVGRVVKIKARGFSDYTELYSEKDFWDLLVFFGAGVDIVKHYIEVCVRQGDRLIYILSSKFEDFCKENGLDVDLVLDEAEN